jgi:hypothetical protein
LTVQIINKAYSAMLHIALLQVACIIIVASFCNDLYNVLCYSVSVLCGWCKILTFWYVFSLLWLSIVILVTGVGCTSLRNGNFKMWIALTYLEFVKLQWHLFT